MTPVQRSGYCEDPAWLGRTPGAPRGRGTGGGRMSRVPRADGMERVLAKRTLIWPGRRTSNQNKNQDESLFGDMINNRHLHCVCIV